MQSIGLNASLHAQGCGVLVFLWDYDCGVRKFRTPESNDDSGHKKNLDSTPGQNPTPTLGLILCDVMITYLRMT